MTTCPVGTLVFQFWLVVLIVIKWFMVSCAGPHTIVKRFVVLRRVENRIICSFSIMSSIWRCRSSRVLIVES